MSRLIRFLVLGPLFLGGLLLLFIAAVHLAQIAGVISNEQDWRSLIKELISTDSHASSQLKVRRSIRPRAVVVLDAGHGGVDGGTVAGKSLEKDLNMKVVHLVAEQLRQERIRVVYTRQGDTTQSLSDRVAVANGYPAALFVSVHHNASSSEKPEGFETYFTHPKPSSVLIEQRKIFAVKEGAEFIDRRGELLAREIQASSCSSTQAVDRGIKNGSMVLTRLVSCPAVLVECGFLSNSRERSRLKDSKYREKLSAGISRGILAFLVRVEENASYGIEPKSKLSTPEGSGGVQALQHAL
jgi:N-acetylmuramoyl-L-alanine amidase